MKKIIFIFMSVILYTSIVFGQYTTSDLFEAIRSGSSKVNEIIASGVSLNVRDSNGNTVLIEAASLEELAIVKKLIAKGVNVNAKNNRDSTALMYASNGHTEIVKALIEAGADVNAKDNYGMTALMYAFNEHTEIVKALIETGADVNAKNNEGYTSLMIASLKGYTEIVEILKAAGAR